MIIVCNQVGSITIARRGLNLIAYAFCSFSLLTFGGEVNVYSARHYDTDILMYEEFTSQTGHRINLIEGGSDALIERIAIEGEYSPADILITVDAGRLWRAKERGIFRPIESETLSQRVPSYLRDRDGYWSVSYTHLRAHETDS